MPTTDQKSDLLFKKYLGKGSSGTSSLYFNEPLDGRSAVFPVQIWQNQSLIPSTAASVPDVVEQVSNLVLTQVPGQPFAFYSAQLRDAIPFNYDFSGSYVPAIRRSDNSVIAFGENDWVIDVETGMLTFYAGLPSGVSDTLPPNVTFWKYIGPKGIPTGSATASWAGTASYAETASYAFTSSYTIFAELSSASYNSITALTAMAAGTADRATSASHAEKADLTYTASISLYSKTASFIGSAGGGGGIAGGTASYAMKTPFAENSNTASFAYFAQVTLGTASYAYVAINALDADHADYAEGAGTANTASYVAEAKTAITASHAIYAEIALGTSSYAIDAGHSDTASYLDMAGGTASFALVANSTRYTASYAIHGDWSKTSASSSYAITSSFAETASFAYFAQVSLGTSSYTIDAETASYLNMAGGTASFAMTANNTRYTASYALQAKTASYANNASTSDQAITASHAIYAEIALGTSSYAIAAGSSDTASYLDMAGGTASFALTANSTRYTASFSLRGDWSKTSSYSYHAAVAEQADTASFAYFAQVALGTSSYSVYSETSSYVSLARSASYALWVVSSSHAEDADHSITSSYSIQSYHASTADVAVAALSASQATFAFSTLQSSSSISSSWAEIASYALTASLAQLAVTTSYALTASYFDGTASGSAINIGLPTDGYYGSGSNGNIAGLGQGDKMEDALDKLDVILDKLTPIKPPALSTKAITLVSSYAARMAGTNTSYTNVTDDQTPSFAMVGGMTASNAFSDGNNGTLAALVDGTDIGNKVLTPNDDTGTYGGLQITADVDYYAGQSGKQGFWNALLAQVNVQSAIDDDLPHTASLSHTLTGTCTPAYFYVDNPQTPGPLFGDVAASGLTYISGVPAFVGGVSSSNVVFSATASFGFTWRFYNNTRVFAGSGTGIASTNFALPSAPTAGSVISGSCSAAFTVGGTSENASYTITAYNSKGGASALAINNTHYRIDSTLDTSNRVTSGIGQYPSSGYGSAFDAALPLSFAGNEELQMLNGQYRYPTGNYTGSLPVAGPDYSGILAGTYNNMRWVTINLGAVSAASNLTLTFTNNSNFSGNGSPMSNFDLYVRINGSTPTAGWVDGNAAYPGVGSPTNNGDAALVVANSTSTAKLITFGTITKTGNVYARIGIPSGDTKRFTNVTMTAA